ncbi:MAG TPA: hypothetical protein VJK04_03065 [Candidatus Paceibacterota bacterium]
MFPPKTVGIIGNLGQMATNVVTPLFREAGYDVIGSDIKNLQGLTNKEVVKVADVVYFSVLPISEVASIIRDLIPYAKPDTLWLHGTSIQNPVGGPITPVLLDERLIAQGVTTGFLHFMVGPMTRSLRGQSIMYGFLSPATDNNRWEEWLVNLLKTKHPVLVGCTPEEHDSLTTVSQVIPMIVSQLVGQLGKIFGSKLFQGIRLGGPPCWLQFYAMLRSLNQGSVVANILTNHPYTKIIVRDASVALRAIGAGRVPELETMARDAMGVFTKDQLALTGHSTEWHICLEGDLRSGAACFNFSAEENKLGLLTAVLKIFDEHGLNKTSCMAQEVPSGGCRFEIGLKEIEDPRVKDACDQIIREFGGKQFVRVPR